MDKIIVTNGSGINGNVGSCEVKTAYVQKDSWNTTAIAVNSCTGQVIESNTYFDWSYIYFPVMAVVVLFIVRFIWSIFD